MVEKNTTTGSSHFGSAEMNPASIHQDAGLTPGLAQRVKDPQAAYAVALAYAGGYSSD